MIEFLILGLPVVFILGADTNPLTAQRITPLIVRPFRRA